MRQLTLRGVDDELHERLLRLAQEEGISLNQAALKLLRKAAELENGVGRFDPATLSRWAGGVDAHGRARTNGPTADRGLDPALAAVFGSMTPEESAELEEALQFFHIIDEAMWN